MYTYSQPAVEKVKQEMSNLRIANADTHLHTTPKDVIFQPSVSASQHTPGNVPAVHTHKKRYLDPHANPTYLKQPAQQRWDPDSTLNQTAATPAVTKYLMRREVVTFGSMEFDDHPEKYWTWKMSFQSVIYELTLTPRAELDLLIKWLEPVSKEQAKRI